MKSWQYIMSILLVLVFPPPDAAANDLIIDTVTLAQVRDGIDQIYNYEFREAEKILEILEQRYPEHPLTTFYEGLIYYWKYYPVMPEWHFYYPKELSIKRGLNTTLNYNRVLVIS